MTSARVRVADRLRSSRCTADLSGCRVKTGKQARLSRSVAVAARDDGPYLDLDAANASNGRYPLTRYMYIRLNVRPGEKPSPPVREFLRYVLSRDGQEPILYSGYFPLTADEVRAELAKLD